MLEILSFPCFDIHEILSNLNHHVVNDVRAGGRKKKEEKTNNVKKIKKKKTAKKKKKKQKKKKKNKQNSINEFFLPLKVHVLKEFPSSYFHPFHHYRSHHDPAKYLAMPDPKQD